MLRVRLSFAAAPALRWPHRSSLARLSFGVFLCVSVCEYRSVFDLSLGRGVKGTPVNQWVNPVLTGKKAKHADLKKS